MDKIYLIIRTDFDDLENHDPIRQKTLGYAESAEHATAILKALESSEPKYKGWDFSWTNREYPRFSIKEVNKY